MEKVYCMICGTQLEQIPNGYKCPACAKEFEGSLVDACYNLIAYNTISADEGTWEVERVLERPVFDDKTKEILNKPNGDGIVVLREHLRKGVKETSISLIQREFGFGFPKAAKVFDWLVYEGFVKIEHVGKKKPIVINKEEFEKRFGKIED